MRGPAAAAAFLSSWRRLGGHSIQQQQQQRHSEASTIDRRWLAFRLLIVRSVAVVSQAQPPRCALPHDDRQSTLSLHHI